MSVKRLVLRAVSVVLIFIGAGMYIVVMAGFLPPVWEFMQSMPAVRNGPFWQTAKRFKFLATTVVPGVLIASGVFVWIVSAVREEGNMQSYQVRQ